MRPASEWTGDSLINLVSELIVFSWHASTTKTKVTVGKSGGRMRRRNVAVSRPPGAAKALLTPQAFGVDQSPVAEADDHLGRHDEGSVRTCARHAAPSG